MNLDSRTSELAAKHGANWKTISGAKVLIGKGGKIIAGMGGKFSNLADTKKGANASGGGSFAFTEKSSMEYWVGAEKANEMASLVNGAGLGDLWAKNANDVPMIGDMKGRAYYDPAYESIHFDRNRIRVGDKGSYHTIIHEMSHAIDYKNGSRDGFSYEYKDGAFDKALRADVDARIKTKQAEMKVRLKELASKHKDARELTIMLESEGFVAAKDLMKTQLNIEKGKLPAVNATAACRAIGMEMNRQPIENRRACSDIYGGASGMKVKAGYGHSAAYWKRDRAYLSAEAFAQMSAAKSCNKAEYEMIKEYFPTAHKVYEEMVVDMAKL